MLLVASWIAGFIVGAVAVAIGIFLGERRTARKAPHHWYPTDSEPNAAPEYNENRHHYNAAISGHRSGLDMLGVRAGRVTMVTQPHLRAWDNQIWREHADYLYANVNERMRSSQKLQQQLTGYSGPAPLSPEEIERRAALGDTDA